jgi:septum formation protein
VSETLILASGSASRALVMRGAGLSFVQVKPGVDEDAVKASMRAEGEPPRRQAEVLAETKAMKVSAQRPGVVLGADQMLDLGGEGFDKPASVEEARAQLKRLRGHTHILQTALVACVEGAPVWRFIAQPRLTMRPFSDAFLDQYLAASDLDVTETVGGYKLEGLGAQLFERIEGDYFSILGLPLLPLLQWLRDRGTLPK